MYCYVTVNMKKKAAPKVRNQLTEVRLVGTALETNSFLRALYQEVSHQLSRQVAFCRDTEHISVYCTLIWFICIHMSQTDRWSVMEI